MLISIRHKTFNVSILISFLKDVYVYYKLLKLIPKNLFFKYHGSNYEYHSVIITGAEGHKSGGARAPAAPPSSAPMVII